MSRSALDLLAQAGFVHAGAFSFRDGEVLLDHAAPHAPGVYAFALQDDVRYVGSTMGDLAQRLRFYRQRQRNARDTRPVHAELGRALSVHGAVQIYVLAPSTHETRAIEDSLLRRLAPAWNRIGVKPPRHVRDFAGAVMHG